MKLYHGTSEKYLSSILKNGITPRATNKISNWEDAPSNPHMIYLTDTHPLIDQLFLIAKALERLEIFLMNIQP